MGREFPMVIFAAMWNEPAEIKTRKQTKKTEPKDMVEVITERKTMIALLKDFMPWFPSGLHLNITFSDHLIRNKTKQYKTKHHSYPAQPYAIPLHSTYHFFVMLYI